MTFHPFYVLVDVGSVDYEEEVVLCHLVHEQVVNGSAILIAHHSVENLAWFGSAHIVGEDVVDVSFGVRTLYGHFAHV